MKYMGSKNRIAKQILPIMLKEVSENKNKYTYYNIKEQINNFRK